MTETIAATGSAELETAAGTVRWDQDSPRWRWARFCNSVCRVRDLRRANAVFGNLNKPTRVTRSLFDATLHLDLSRSTAQQLLYLTGERFVTELGLLRQLVRRGMSVVDVGSNIGYHLLFFEQQVGGEGRVICIEPSPDNLIELKANIRGNGFQNVELHELALGAKSGSVGVRGGINSGVVDRGNAIATVPLKTLSDVVNEPVDVVKIDVDGYEGHVLAGGAELLKREQPILILEVHPHLLPRFGTTTGEVIQQVRRVYPALAAFDQHRPAETSPFRRICQRYVAPFRLKKIVDLDRLSDRSDRALHDWTFWVIAARSHEFLPS